MRMGFIGPAEGDVALFEERLHALIERHGAARVHYLGDDLVLEEASLAARRALGLSGGGGYEGAVAGLAATGTPDEIERFLAAGRTLARIHECRAVPPSPTRTVEMIEDRVLVLVFDKSVLDEEDIENAAVIVFGKAEAPLARKFGARVFFCPGAARLGYGLATLDASGALTFAAFDAQDKLVVEASLAPRSARFSVSS